MHLCFVGADYSQHAFKIVHRHLRYCIMHEISYVVEFVLLINYYCIQVDNVIMDWHFGEITARCSQTMVATVDILLSHS